MTKCNMQKKKNPYIDGLQKFGAILRYENSSRHMSSINSICNFQMKNDNNKLSESSQKSIK